MNEEHVPKAMEFKLSITGERLKRIPCTCNWAGVWYAADEFARRSIERHITEATKGDQ